MASLVRRTLLAWTAAGLSLAGGAGSAPSERTFYTGYPGTVPHDKKDEARTYFNQPAVRDLIYRLETGPIPADEASRRLASQASLADLARLSLVRRLDDGRVRLGFAYFTAQDMRRIHAMTARFAPRLAAAYRGRARAFADIWRRYPVSTVDPGKLAFVLISGIGLNWDALDILFDGGWRKPRFVSGAGWRYSFFAAEETPGFSYKGFYWGSSAFPADLAIPSPMPLAYASFGDPDSDPRMNLPDLMGLRASDMTPAVRSAAERLGFHDDPLIGPGVLGVETGRRLGRRLLALREGRQFDETASAELAAADLELLRATGYVRRDAPGQWRLTTPVLARADAPILAAARVLNRAILVAWIKAHYAAMRMELAGLTAMAQGLPYEALFTQIWHELFGLTTRELVETGMTADPYAKGSPSPGSLAMAYAPELIQRVWR